MAREQTVPDADLRRAAREWVVRLAGPEVTAADRLAFDVWLAGPPERAEAYRRSLRLYGAAGELIDRFPITVPIRPAGGDRRSRWALAIGGALAASLAVAVVGLQPAATIKPDVATTAAEVRAVRLPDGSEVTLGAKTALEIDFSAGARRVKLGDGEAYFQVAHDSARPFFVEARGTTVRVVGTEFEVKVSPQAVKVAVTRGVVDVRERPQLGRLEFRPQAQRLTAGQQVVVVAAASTPPQVVATTRAPAAWREGFLTYEDAPLSEVVADANRYGRRPVILAEAALGDLRVTGSYPADRLDQMLDSLEAGLPLAAERRADGAVVLRPSAP